MFIRLTRLPCNDPIFVNVARIQSFGYRSDGGSFVAMGDGAAMGDGIYHVKESAETITHMIEDIGIDVLLEPEPREEESSRDDGLGI